ncbi:MAG: aldo/keto reductase [Cyanophyceae cyanobacterium]
MDSKRLGTTEIEISAIGLGGMPLSLSTRPPVAQALAVIHRALDLGVTLIDTADSYCQDESDKHHNERLITKALQHYQGDTSQVTVATKGGLMRPRGEWTSNGNPEHLRETIRASYEALAGPITLWQYHSPDPNYTIAESLAPVKAAVAEGLVRYVGVSNFSVEQIERAREVVEIVSVQNQYNPWHRQPEFDGVLEYCEQEQLTFFPYRPLRGRFKVDSVAENEAIAELAAAKGVSPYQIVLAWHRAKSPCIVPIPGATKPASIESSVGSVAVNLSPEEVQQIDKSGS